MDDCIVCMCALYNKAYGHALIFIIASTLHNWSIQYSYSTSALITSGSKDNQLASHPSIYVFISTALSIHTPATSLSPYRADKEIPLFTGSVVTRKPCFVVTCAITPLWGVVPWCGVPCSMELWWVSCRVSCGVSWWVSCGVSWWVSCGVSWWVSCVIYTHVGYGYVNNLM